MNFKNNMQMKKITVLFIMAIAVINVSAQQDAMFTHYAYNTLAVNPGYAGTRDALTVTGLYRNQWVGFDGAPVTQTLTLHTPVFNNKLGVGMSFVNDKIGPLRSTSVYGDIAYKIKLSTTGRLAFGLKGGGNLVQGNFTSLTLNTTGDNAFSENIRSSFKPNFGFGVYYYSAKAYVGLSTPTLLENEFNSSASAATNKLIKKRHYFFIAGTVFDIGKNGSLKFKPTTFVKVTDAAPIEADVTGMFIFNNKIELGAMFRTGDAVGLLLGYNVTPQLRFGYSYDFSYTNKTIKYNGGSHEIMLRYDFFYKEKGGIISPRYF